MRTQAILTAGLLLLTPSLASGQAERFVLEKTDGGFMRMDRQTGAMSFCRERSGELVCRGAAEERRAHEDEIEALRERLAALEARVEALEERRETATLPTEEEFEQTLGFMERFFRSFVDIVRGLEEEEQQQQPQDGAATAPDRT